MGFLGKLFGKPTQEELVLQVIERHAGLMSRPEAEAWLRYQSHPDKPFWDYIHLLTSKAEYEEVIRECDRKLAQEFSIDIVYRKALTYFDLNKPESALEVGLNALKAFPQDSQVLNMMGRLSLLAGRPDLALHVFGTSVKLLHEQDDILDTLKRIRQVLRDTPNTENDEALFLFEWSKVCEPSMAGWFAREANRLKPKNSNAALEYFAAPVEKVNKDGRFLYWSILCETETATVDIAKKYLELSDPDYPSDGDCAVHKWYRERVPSHVIPFEKILRGKYGYPTEDWKSVLTNSSEGIEEAKSLINVLIEIERISEAVEICEWITAQGSDLSEDALAGFWTLEKEEIPPHEINRLAEVLPATEWKWELLVDLYDLISSNDKAIQACEKGLKEFPESKVLQAALKRIKA